MTQYGSYGQPRGPVDHGKMRVGDAERDEAVRLLGEHFVVGRLNDEEHAQRVGSAYTAKTRDDLDGLFQDLPTLTPAQPQGWHDKSQQRAQSGPWQRRPRFPVAPLVLIMLAVLIFGPFLLLVPLILFPLLAMVFISRAASHAKYGPGPVMSGRCRWDQR